MQGVAKELLLPRAESHPIPGPGVEMVAKFQAEQRHDGTDGADQGGPPGRTPISVNDAG